MLIDTVLTSLSMFHSIVTRHRQSFKTPPAYEPFTREASAAPAASSLPVIRTRRLEAADRRGTMNVLPHELPGCACILQC